MLTFQYLTSISRTKYRGNLEELLRKPESPKHWRYFVIDAVAPSNGAAGSAEGLMDAANGYSQLSCEASARPADDADEHW